MHQILKTSTIILGSISALLFILLLLFRLFIETKIPSSSQRFIEGTKITSPDLKKCAYVYTIDSPMSFGSMSTRLCVLDKSQTFTPDDDYTLFSEYGFSVIGWKSTDTLMITTDSDNYQLTDKDEATRKQDGLWVEYKKLGEIILEVYHLKTVSSSLTTFEIDSLYVRGDSLFITTTQSWDEWKYFAVNMGSVIIDRNSPLIDTLEVLVIRIKSIEKYREPTAEFYRCYFIPKKPIKTSFFNGLPIRERLQRSMYRK